MKIRIPRFYLAILLLSIVIFVFIEWMTPRDISWETSFSSHDKMPYGTFVLAEMLPQLFPGQQMNINTSNYYELLNDSSKASLIIINKEFTADEYSIYALLDFVDKGGQVFVSAFDFDQILLDTLGLDISSKWTNKSIGFNYLDESLKSDTNYSIDYQYGMYFELDSIKVQFEAISYFDIDHINFIKIKIGDGNLYLNSMPLAFTNYNILKGNTNDYVEKAFSMMAVKDIVWDEHIRQHQFNQQSMLQFITGNPSLQTAYYVSTVLLILFAIFYGKRRQKLIPLVEPLRNNSLDFVETISNLYLQQHKHQNIANKRILYFLDNIYLRYQIKSRELNDELIKKLSLRSGKEEAEVRALVVALKYYQNSSKINETELLDLNKKIESFYQQ